MRRRHFQGGCRQRLSIHVRSVSSGDAAVADGLAHDESCSVVVREQAAVIHISRLRQMFSFASVCLFVVLYLPRRQRN